MGAPTVTKTDPPISTGGLYKEVFGYLSGPASYTTGGDSLAARDLGLTTIQHLEILCISGDRIAHPVFAANDAPETSVLLLMTDNAGTEIVNTTDMSAKKFRFRATGQY